MKLKIVNVLCLIIILITILKIETYSANAIDVSTGTFHTIAVNSDGTVWAWGMNDYGQLGDGTRESSFYPLQVLELSGIISVKGGQNHTIALKSDGTVWTWGQNYDGQLGNGSNTDNSTPTQVLGLTDVVKIDAGKHHCIVVKSDGTVWTWGRNAYGQLGNGSIIQSNIPVQVVGLTNVTEVSANGEFSLALLATGEVYGWGNNYYGQLGDGTTVDKHTPVQVLGLDNITEISNGEFHSLALTENGDVWAWGRNNNRQLGDGTLVNKVAPVQTTELENIVSIGAGNIHSLAIKSDGTAWAWGNNVYGQLGDGTTTNRITPVQINGISNGIRVSGGQGHSAILTSEGTILVFGYNAIGQIGNGIQPKFLVPIQTLSIDNVEEISGGELHSLAVKGDGTVWAWGRGSSGQIGDGTTLNRKLPSQTLIEDVSIVSAGRAHSLALKQDGTVWAWGLNDYGQLGDGTTTSETIPIQVNGLTGVVQISGGYYHSLALKSDGTVWSWGRNQYGQLGDGGTTNNNSPVQVQNLSDVIAISSGYLSSFALKSDGTVWAWGRNNHGELGDGTTIDKTIPVKVKDINNITAISGGYFHSFALKSDGTVWAWGYNNSGQLGDDTTVNRNVPINIQGLEDVLKITGGGNHTLALKSDGAVWSFGYNNNGQLGDGTLIDRQIPTRILGLSNVVSISCGSNHSLAISEDLNVFSWGNNDYSQIGNDTSTNELTPTINAIFGPPVVLNVTANLPYAIYKENQEVSIKVVFSKIIYVDGFPRILLKVGDNIRSADYVSGSGSNTLTFVYTVQGNDESQKVKYTGIDSLELNEGTMKDEYNINAVLELPQSEGVGSLFANTIIKVDGIRPIIILNGDEEITIEVEAEYLDEGASATDNFDGDISGNIVINNTVDTNTVGDYIITYNVSDSVGNAADEVIRTVHVVDTTKPVITLIGNTEVTIRGGTVYIDDGATANDNYDGNISESIIIDSSTVNTSIVGSYTVTYNVTDSGGNMADEVIRTVNVIGKVRSSSGGKSNTSTDNQDKAIQNIVEQIVNVVEKEPINTYDKALETRNIVSDIAKEMVTIEVENKQLPKDTIQVKINEKELQTRLENIEKMTNMLDEKLKENNMKRVLNEDLMTVKISSNLSTENLKIILPAKKLTNSNLNIKLQINNIIIPTSALKTKQIKDIVDNNANAYIQCEIKNINELSQAERYLVYLGNNIPIKNSNIVKEIELCFNILDNKGNKIVINELSDRVEIQIDIPQELESKEKEKLVVYNSNEEFIGGSYNSKTDKVQFKVNMVGRYKIVKEEKTFEDIIENPCKNYIEILASKHLTEGISDKEYAPKMLVTRAQAATFVQRILDLQIPEYQGKFEDVPKEKWYSGPIEAVSETGIVEGVGNNKFNPNMPITNEEFVTILMRTYYYVTGEEENISKVNTKDFDDASQYAKNKLEAAYVKGILETTANYDISPKAKVNRENAARIIIKFLRIVQ